MADTQLGRDAPGRRRGCGGVTGLQVEKSGALPLDGVTVIDLSQIYNGPYATFLLAMAGATVIKIEPPGGETLRRRGVVENVAPGVMDRLGLGCAALHAINPRLIYAQSSGFGSSGPYRDYPAMDLTVQAMAGVMSITGFSWAG